MEEEEKYRIIRHQMWNEPRNAKIFLRHTDVYYCVVVGRLDLDLYALYSKQEHPLFTHAQWFAHYVH